MLNNRIQLDGDISFRLTLMKFLAIIAVVFIHTDYPTSIVNPQNLAVVYYCDTVVSGYICHFAVPLFFCISGFIYFAKGYQHNMWNFTAKKVKEILFPYILWNTIAITYIFAAQIPDVTRRYFTDYLIIENFDLGRWVSCYIGFSDAWLPFLYPLWFMPYLFVTFIIIHLFRNFINRHSNIIWVVSAVISICCHSIKPLADILASGPVLRLISALSFFTFGIFCLKNMQLFDNKKVFWISGIIFACTAPIDMSGILEYIKILPITLYCGVIFMFCLSARINKCSPEAKKRLAFISGFSFVIYVTHEFALYTIKRILVMFVPLKTLPFLLIYWLVPIALIGIIILCGALLKKLFPGFYKFLFAGR